MKVIEVSFDMVKINLQRNKKIMVIVILCFIILGIFVGGICAQMYSPSEKIVTDQIEDTLDLSLLEKDGEYYYNAFLNLKRKKNYLDSYLLYFEQVDVNSVNRERLAELKNILLEYGIKYNEAFTFYQKNPLSIKNKVDETVEFYGKEMKKLVNSRNNIERYIDEVASGRYTDSYKTIRQSKLNSDLIKVQNNIDIFSTQIEALKSSDEESLENNVQEADILLEENYKSINKIILLFNNTLEELAETENYEIVYNKRLLNDYFASAGMGNEIEEDDILANQRGKAIIYAKSIAGLDAKKEIFFAMMTFFSLVGITLAILIGCIHDAKNK